MGEGVIGTEIMSGAFIGIGDHGRRSHRNWRPWMKQS